MKIKSNIKSFCRFPPSPVLLPPGERALGAGDRRGGGVRRDPASDLPLGRRARRRQDLRRRPLQRGRRRPRQSLLRHSRRIHQAQACSSIDLCPVHADPIWKV